jgi:glycosyltransferase involved in cell wall biosynthesis
MLLYLPLTLFCLFIAACCMQAVLREYRAPRLTSEEDCPSDPPLISVLIPARNEAARIQPLMEGLARQSYKTFEVIVVDDDSSDGTGDLVQRYTACLPALEVLHGTPLPAGWAGKCWACQQAANRARGEWLLFLDADVDPQPHLLGALAGRAAARAGDLITLMPLLRLGSLAERVVLPAFGSILHNLYPLVRVNDPRDSLVFANGQCIFVRRTVYTAAGGHRAVRDSVLEDVDLARRVRQAGYRLHAAHAPDLLSVRMYTDWESICEGLGKNAVAGYRSGGSRSAWVGTRQSLIAFAPWYMLIGAGLLWAGQPVSSMVLLLHGAMLALLTLSCSAWITRRRYQIGGAWGLLYPLGLAIYFGLALRALVHVRGGRGVVWKGRRLAG